MRETFILNSKACEFFTPGGGSFQNVQDFTPYNLLQFLPFITSDYGSAPITIKLADVIKEIGLR